MGSEKQRYSVCHLTSVHKSNDVRIFLKECTSLAKKYETTLIAVNGVEGTYNNVNVINVPVKISNRLERFTKAVDAVYKKALELNCDLYHLHDPELLRIAIKLKRKGKRVIYDAHEDLPEQLLSKPYLNKSVAKVISFGLRYYENDIASKLDAVVTATPFIRQRFAKINKHTIDINNYPLFKELDQSEVSETKENKVCYIGGVTKIRGLAEIVDALELSGGVRLDLAGEFSNRDFEQSIKSKKGWTQVNELGFINREKSLEVKKKSLAGLVTFLPVANHINAQPNKIFEYMASGLPVIGSNFPLWKTIIEDNQVGICVDPTDPKEIADAIVYILEHPDVAKKMGDRGKELVLEKYNWNIEEQKLFHLYDRILN